MNNWNVLMGFDMDEFYEAWAFFENGSYTIDTDEHGMVIIDGVMIGDAFDLLRHYEKEINKSFCHSTKSYHVSGDSVALTDDEKKLLEEFDRMIAGKSEKCECGGEAANTTHINWCPKYSK